MTVERVEYWAARGARTGRLWSVFVDHRGPWLPRSLLLNAATGLWVFDPDAVEQARTQDLQDGSGAISQVDRARAEELARELGWTLPPEIELRDRLAAEAAVHRT